MQALYKPVLYNGWMAATTGQQEYSEKHEKALVTYFANFSDPDAFHQVMAYKKREDLSLLQRRQLDDLYNKMVKNQIETEEVSKTIQLEKKISQVFTTYRPQLKGKEVTNNDLLDVLKNRKDNSERKEAWLASKQIGKKIEKDILTLVRKRNADARALGFDNFYQMSFETQELEMDVVFNTFQKLVELSNEPFRKIKDEIDQELANKFEITIDELRPWHYVDPFFQEAPPVSGFDMDQFYKGKDLEQIVTNTFQAMGLDIVDILEKSDLYPRKNKNPFGFCTNIDREGDVRVLINLDESVFWSTALLHEFGHAAYFKYIDRTLPFLLRFHSHTLTTEAIALFFGRMNKTWDWQKQFLGLNEDELAKITPFAERLLQRQMLVSARWMMTFSFFERELYENPDQDLNNLWWKLVQEIQFINPPEETQFPDWAAKMHFSLAPASYQDYLLGELTASQLQTYIEQNISANLFKPEVGKYLIEHFFKPGASLHWNEKIKMATGEYLDPEYFSRQFL
ncbi:M3 family oligoendopeptidase [Anaerobacillus sp. CMMVII]|nr:M3 family oligoendopeptidase [Anaerobacillus sp. CMMVII]